jgi:hypothetical protein
MRLLCDVLPLEVATYALSLFRPVILIVALVVFFIQVDASVGTDAAAHDVTGGIRAKLQVWWGVYLK